MCDESVVRNFFRLTREGMCVEANNKIYLPHWEGVSPLNGMFQDSGFLKNFQFVYQKMLHQGMFPGTITIEQQFRRLKQHKRTSAHFIISHISSDL